MEKTEKRRVTSASCPVANAELLVCSSHSYPIPTHRGLATFAMLRP